MKRQLISLQATVNAFLERSRSFDNTVEAVRMNLATLWNKDWPALVGGKAMIRAFVMNLETLVAWTTS